MFLVVCMFMRVVWVLACIPARFVGRPESAPGARIDNFVDSGGFVNPPDHGGSCDPRQGAALHGLRNAKNTKY